MLAYLDTNALVKLYLSEAGGEVVLSLLDQTDGVVTSVLTYPETRGVFARLQDRRLATAEQYQEMLAQFETDWPLALRVELSETLYRRAGDLMVQHPKLRALDAVHLSSALEARTQYDLQFLTFDQNLRTVALALLGPQIVK